MALGKLNDPVFGTTTADMYFNLSSSVYGSSPFGNKDSVLGIDSVVLQLAYAGAYGDTTGASSVNVEVAQINKGNDFTDTMLYRYDHPGFSTGPAISSTSFTVPQFKDTITLIRKSDTTRVANVLRVRLNNSLGQELSQIDTAGNGGYKNDSLFRTVFRGLAVRTTSVSGAGTLAYFNLISTGTALTVYYRSTKNGVKDTSSAVFQHAKYSQANSIRRTPGGEYLANINAINPQQLYIQSSPQGSYVGIGVPQLNTFPNKVIHRAELIAYKLPSSLETTFASPQRLLLDHKGASDTAFLFDNDIQPNPDGSINLASFGGHLRSDNSYRFNITRYVQGIVTRKERNDTLRLYAPFRSVLFSRAIGNRFVSVPNMTNIAYGRVVLAGTTHPDPALRLRLRIVYSNL
jgi:hypothetical protein